MYIIRTRTDLVIFIIAVLLGISIVVINLIWPGALPIGSRYDESPPRPTHERTVINMVYLSDLNASADEIINKIIEEKQHPDSYFALSPNLTISVTVADLIIRPENSPYTRDNLVLLKGLLELGADPVKGLMILDAAQNHRADLVELMLPNLKDPYANILQKPIKQQLLDAGDNEVDHVVIRYYDSIAPSPTIIWRPSHSNDFKEKQ